MTLVKLTLFAANLAGSLCHGPKESMYNIGWDKFLEDSPEEFHNLPLTWETENPIPDYIVGSYIKNGPSQKKFGTEERYYNSYADAWAKLNKVTFTEGGEVLYSGRMLETINYMRCKEADKIVPSVTMSGVSPNDFTFAEQMEGFSHGYDNTNVITWRLGGPDSEDKTYMATTDAPLINIIDPDTLGVKEQYMPPFPEELTLGSSSHWRREIGTNNSINFHINQNIFFQLHFHLLRFGSNLDDKEEIAKFPVDYLSLIHMISNSKNYAVVIWYPVTMNMMDMPAAGGHLLDTLEVLDIPTRIYLIDLRDGTVHDYFETEDESMVYATHIMNVWEEEGDKVVFDVSTNPWTALRDATDIHNMLDHNETDTDESPSVMKRVTLNINTKETLVEEWPIAPEAPRWTNTVDFPFINDNYAGLKNRYAYGWIGVDMWRQTLIKKDLEHPENYKTWFKESHYPGEMFFIPNPEGVGEDDGTLITISFDGEREQSYVMLIDAKTFEEINTAFLPYHVPFSFHGNWFPELH